MGRSNQPPLLFYRRSVKEQLTYPEALEKLRGAYKREKVQLTVKISTLEVTISQQNIQIIQFKKEIEKLKTNSPEPFPYTHPVRNISAYSKSKRSEPNA